MKTLLAPLALVAALGIGIAAPAAGFFDEDFRQSVISQPDYIFEQALGRLIVPSATIRETNCYVEYQGGVYIDAPCRVAMSNDSDAFSIGGPNKADAIEDQTVFVVDAWKDATDQDTAPGLAVIRFGGQVHWIGSVTRGNKFCWSNQQAEICMGDIFRDSSFRGLPLCSREFARDAETPLPTEPCRLVSQNWHSYVCSKELGGCQHMSEEDEQKLEDERLGRTGEK